MCNSILLFSTLKLYLISGGGGVEYISLDCPESFYIYIPHLGVDCLSVSDQINSLLSAIWGGKPLTFIRLHAADTSKSPQECSGLADVR